MLKNEGLKKVAINNYPYKTQKKLVDFFYVSFFFQILYLIRRKFVYVNYMFYISFRFCHKY